MAFVGDRLDAHAETRPGVAALICGERVWTWSGLRKEIANLSLHVAAVAPAGSRVALSLEDPADLLIAFLAVVRAGGLAMVFDPAWPVSMRQWVEGETRPVLILDADKLRNLRDAEPLPETPIVPPRESDLFYAGFTSGSTGDPKGYCRSHASWLDSFLLSEAEFAIVPEDRVLIPGNLVHSLHLYGAVHGLHAGASVDVAARFQPRKLAVRLNSEDRVVVYATPTQIHYLAAELRRTAPAESVRLVLASGAKWQAEDRENMAALFPAARLVEFYGASEMSFITISAPEDPVPGGSVGRPAHGVQVRVGDPVAGPVPPGTPGPIWVKSPLLFDRYICGGGEEVRWRDGWLTVGDHGYLDENDYLFLVGREKRMIVTSGLNIHPEQVERILERHEGVRAAAVFGLPDQVRGSRLVAAIAPEPGSIIEDGELRRLCLAELGRARTPRAFRTLANWPLTAGGKTDLKAIERLLLDDGRAGAVA
jgi:long-chain acyl-CoA synthetase